MKMGIDHGRGNSLSSTILSVTKSLSLIANSRPSISFFFFGIFLTMRSISSQIHQRILNRRQENDVLKVINAK